MTPQEVKKKFHASGQTVAGWAKANKFPPNKVSDVLNGRSPALRGEMHKIAVALGIKPAPQQQNHPANS